MKCVKGCIVFINGDIMHHKDCPSYTGSLAEIVDMMHVKVSNLEYSLDECSARIEFLEKSLTKFNNDL